jgi:hypothetical protein
MIDKEVEVGYESVTIKKMFGPLIFANLKITAIPETCSWKIERETMIPTGKEEEPFDAVWLEICSISAQLDWKEENAKNS